MSHSLAEKLRIRRGVSLIELTVLIGASSMLFAVAIVAFTRFIDMRRHGQEHLERTVQSARFAEQFRRDVWESRESSPASGATDKILLTAPNGLRIEYQIEDATIRRTAFENDDRRMQDEFRFPGATPIRFEIEDGKVAVLIAPLKSQVVEGEDPYGKPVRIVATLAHDRRFQSAEAP